MANSVPATLTGPVQDSIREAEPRYDAPSVGKDNSGTLILSKPVMMSAPAEGEEACMILLHPPGPDIGKRTRLSGDGEYIVGREVDADFVISRSAVSRHHAKVFRGPEGAWLAQDLGSTNGTFVNEERISTKSLRDGDQLRFGDAIFKFLVGSNVESAYHEEIYRMTILDGLTGVHNKRYFLDFLERELSSAHRHGHPLSLVMFDIDHFKRVNDDRGHLAGDAVLKDLSGRVKPRIRREDLFARYGGEEFAAILTATPMVGGLKFAENLRVLVESTPFEFDGERFTVTVSLGVASVHQQSEITVEQFIKQADGNLYEAKHGGRNRVVPSLAAFGG